MLAGSSTSMLHDKSCGGKAWGRDAQIADRERKVYVEQHRLLPPCVNLNLILNHFRIFCKPLK